MKNFISKYKKDIMTFSLILILFGICVFQYRTVRQKEIKIEKAITSKGEWEMISDSVEATIYNAVPSQCKADVSTTASNFVLDLKSPEKHRIIAIERTMMDRYGLEMGDVVKIEGTDKYDGL